jgi:hypothetical protein
MEVLLQVLAAVAGITVYPLVGYAVIRLAGRWPRATLALLLVAVAAGAGALGYARFDGFDVPLDTRRMTFRSEAGRWCFDAGWVAVILGVPALPLVAVARARNGERIGPAGAQWVVVVFGYFMGCAVWGMVLYSWLTGIAR